MNEGAGAHPLGPPCSGAGVRGGAATFVTLSYGVFYRNCPNVIISYQFKTSLFSDLKHTHDGLHDAVGGNPHNKNAHRKRARQFACSSCARVAVSGFLLPLHVNKMNKNLDSGQFAVIPGTFPGIWKGFHMCFGGVERPSRRSALNPCLTPTMITLTWQLHVCNKHGGEISAVTE